MEKNPKSIAKQYPEDESRLKPLGSIPEPTISLEQVSGPRDFLDAVDFNILNQIFDSLVQKSGVETVQHEVRPDMVEVTDVEPPPGSGANSVIGGDYNSHTGKLQIFWKAASGTVEDTGLLPAREALRLLIHESVHARAHEIPFDFSMLRVLKEKVREATTIEEIEKYAALSKKIHLQSRSGLEETWIAPNEKGNQEIYSIGTTLNEAITETIAIEVFSEYIQRTGVSNLLPKEEAGTDYDSISSSYIISRGMLEAFLGAVASNLGTDRDTVWRSLVRTYFSGDVGVEEVMAHFASEFAFMKHDAFLEDYLLYGKEPEVTPETLGIIRRYSEEAAERALRGLNPEFIANALHLR